MVGTSTDSAATTHDLDGAPLKTAPEQAKLATNRHYELPPEVFAAFLDPRMKYSSGLYADEHTTLAAAQTAKLHWVARRLGITGGERVLDIGCGWGSLTLFLAEEYGCEVVGVTPSAPQAAYIRQRAPRGVSVRVGSFSELSPQDIGVGAFDCATMLGSIIHMPDRVGVLRKTHGALRTNGRLYVSESCFRNATIYEEFHGRPGTRHVTDSIFGFADLVPVSTLIAAIEEANFSLTGLADLTAHYHRTIADWESRARQNRDAFDPEYFDALIHYFQTANAGWGYTTKHYAMTAVRSRLGPKELP